VLGFKVWPFQGLSLEEIKVAKGATIMSDSIEVTLHEGVSTTTLSSLSPGDFFLRDASKNPAPLERRAIYIVLHPHGRLSNFMRGCNTVPFMNLSTGRIESLEANHPVLKLKGKISLCPVRPWEVNR
jgi:hypothetical protein